LRYAHAALNGFRHQFQGNSLGDLVGLGSIRRRASAVRGRYRRDFPQRWSESSCQGAPFNTGPDVAVLVSLAGGRSCQRVSMACNYIHRHFSAGRSRCAGRNRSWLSVFARYTMLPCAFFPSSIASNRSLLRSPARSLIGIARAACVFRHRIDQRPGTFLPQSTPPEPGQPTRRLRAPRCRMISSTGSPSRSTNLRVPRPACRASFGQKPRNAPRSVRAPRRA